MGAYSLRYGYGEWNVKFVEMISSIHKWHGYGLLVLSQVAVSLGLAYYLIGLGKKGAAIGLILGNFAVVSALIAYLEIQLQTTLSAPKTALTSSDKVISKEEFIKMVREGKQLAILEGMVLDLEPFIYYHPGGMFVLQQRIGFNLDLPFNAKPYSGIQSNDGAHEGVMHSNIARQVASSLVIGKYGGDTKELPSFPGVDGALPEPVQPVDQATVEATTVISFDYPYRNGGIDVEPTDGWDATSAQRHRGKPVGSLHIADAFKIDRLDDFMVMTPRDDWRESVEAHY